MAGLEWACTHACGSRIAQSVSGASSNFEDVADAPNRVETFRVPAAVEFATQAAHENIDYMGLRIEVVVPDMFQNEAQIGTIDVFPFVVGFEA
jgi:hypothetical protein